MKTHLTEVSQEALKNAISLIKKGGVVAFPTETFYGLGAMALDQEAVDRIFFVKRRSLDKPLPIIVSDQAMVMDLCHEIPDMAQELMARFWPGPLTLILKGKKGLPSGIMDRRGCIALRISSHPVSQALTSGVSGPITATSANVSSAPPCTTAEMVKDQLNGLIPLILDAGPTKGGDASTIIDCTVVSPHILRRGVLYKQLQAEYSVFIQG